MLKEAGLEKYRHEYKYIIDRMQEAVLKTRIRPLLKADSHAGKEGCYQVRSLYFDSLYDSCYYENESGTGVRDKYRIRIYNGNTERISLEKKSKNRQMTLKKGCTIDESICRQLMQGKPVRLTPDLDSDQRMLLEEMQRMALRPAVIVEYLRYPFTEKSGNVRVTFDENISSSNAISDFLQERIAVRPVMEKGMSVLEVKWDEFLPDYIKKHIQLDTLQWCSYSKYYLCRKYNTYGGIRI